MQLTQDQIDFIELIGVLTQEDGFAKIGGMLLALLLLADEPLSFADIAEALQVSKGSISTNARLLENLGMIERVSILGERGCHFTLAQDPFVALLEGKVARLQRAAQAVKSAQVYKIQNGAHSKLKQLVNFYEEGTKHMQTLKEVLLDKVST